MSQGLHSAVSHERTDLQSSSSSSSCYSTGLSGNSSICSWAGLDLRRSRLFEPMEQEYQYFYKARSLVFYFWRRTPLFPETFFFPSPFFPIYSDWMLECLPASNSKGRTIPLERETQNLLISKWKELAYIPHCLIRQPPESEAFLSGVSAP